jgi:hypothetical protein
LQGRSGISDKTTVALHNLFIAFTSLKESSPLVQTQLSWLNEVVKSRALRTTTVSRALSVLVWVILLIGISLSVVVPLFVGAQNIITQAILSSLFSAFIMLHLLVIVHLAYPFTGDVAITAGVFIDFLEETALSEGSMRGP